MASRWVHTSFPRRRRQKRRWRRPAGWPIIFPSTRSPIRWPMTARASTSRTARSMSWPTRSARRLPLPLWQKSITGVIRRCFTRPWGNWRGVRNGIRSGSKKYAASGSPSIRRRLIRRRRSLPTRERMLCGSIRTGGRWPGSVNRWM